MPYVGMRQPRSMRNADTDEPTVGFTWSMRVGDRGRQGVGRSTSVDVVRQPHSSLMSVGITRPMPTSRQSSAVDVVYPPLGTYVEHPSSLGVDVVHPPSTGVSAQVPRRTRRTRNTSRGSAFATTGRLPRSVPVIYSLRWMELHPKRYVE